MESPGLQEAVWSTAEEPSQSRSVMGAGGEIVICSEGSEAVLGMVYMHINQYTPCAILWPQHLSMH